MRFLLLHLAALTGFLISKSVVLGQFASDRPLVAPKTTPTPVTPAAPVVPASATGSSNLTSSVIPASATRTTRPQPVRTTIDPNNTEQHPWSVKAEHGAWMILVRAYSGPESRGMAERFAQDIRNKNIAAYLFERNAIERRSELAQIEAIRKQELAKAEPFIRQMEQAKKEAEAKGHLFVNEPAKIKLPKPYHETPESWAVVIGGFPTMEAAHQALIQVKKIEPPKDTTLLDRVGIGGTEKNQNNSDEWKSSWNYINPYKTAIVVPNPASTEQKRVEKNKLDPFVIKINSDNPYSLLKARKPWTLIVRSFSMPMKVVGKEGTEKTVFDRIFGTGQKNLLDANGDEAISFAQALRSDKMVDSVGRPCPLQAFVLHHNTGSIVTVGEFDAIDSPELLKLQQELMKITFKIEDKNGKPVLGRDGKPEVRRMFDSVSPFPVPQS